MKHRMTEARHTRQIAIRALAVASWIGGLLSFLYGAWIAPWASAIIHWTVQRLPWWYSNTTRPDMLTYLAHPHFLLGLLWLGYYLLAYLWSVTTLSPQQRLARRVAVEQEYRNEYQEWSLHTTHTAPKPQEPISQAWEGELKHQLVNHCYAAYRKALQRFDPPPLVLKTPTTFSYQKHGALRFEGKELVLPEEKVTPEHIHEIMPLLAHTLYDYNADQITTSETHGFPDFVPLGPLLFLTGNCLWVPVVVKHVMEGQTTANAPIEARKRLVFERDAFAVKLGQGPALEHQLRMMEDGYKQRGIIDENIPTLVERIGQLEVLNERERQDMRTLGLNPKEPPLVMDAPRGRIEAASKKRKKSE